MKSTKETKELILSVARLLKDVDNAREDDRKISIAEAVGILTTNIPSVLAAVRGAGEIPAEARDFTQEELDDLYYSFLTEMEWEPTEHNKNLAAAYFLLIRDAYTNALRILNTHRPPRAEVVA